MAHGPAPFLTEELERLAPAIQQMLPAIAATTTESRLKLPLQIAAISSANGAIATPRNAQAAITLRRAELAKCDLLP